MGPDKGSMLKMNFCCFSIKGVVGGGEGVV